MLDSFKKIMVLLAFSGFPTYTDSVLLPDFPLPPPPPDHHRHHNLNPKQHHNLQSSSITTTIAHSMTIITTFGPTPSLPVDTNSILCIKYTMNNKPKIYLIHLRKFTLACYQFCLPTHVCIFNP